MRAQTRPTSTRAPHLLKQALHFQLKLFHNRAGVVHSALEQRESVVDGHHHVLGEGGGAGLATRPDLREPHRPRDGTSALGPTRTWRFCASAGLS